MSAIETRLAELGITLPTPAKPVANYVPSVQSGNILYVSGQVSRSAEVSFDGKLGDTMDVETGAKAARLSAINLIAQLKAAVGDLDRVARVVKLTGFVNSTLGFGDQPKVINGASDLMVEVFGDKGRHARSAVGVASLPFGVAVEVEGIFEIA
ncbi:MAG: RidA family protein [Ancalomicrobiaceae bacterium]|nr:RidA family protein [Ancalomicrobiaceae bacterium]